MKTNLRSLSLVVALAASVASCKKDDAPKQQTELGIEVKTQAEDQSRVSADLDDVANDADAALESNAYFGGRLEQGSNTLSICNVSAVADTLSNPRTITLTYNGNNCQGTTFRSGTVVLSMPAGVRWKTAGSAITLSLQNLKIRRLSDNKSITLNGTQTVTNVSGGLLLNLPTLQSIVHTLSSSNMSITFDDGTQRIWQVGRKRTYTYNNGAVLTVTGTGTNNAAEWGTNRFGHSFMTSITQPLIIRQDCNYRLTAGEIKQEGFATSTVTFGLNSAGQPTTCPGTGNFFYKLTWTGPNGAAFSALLPY